jgi:hypothetical protein
LTVSWKISALRDWRSSNKRLPSLLKKKARRMSACSWTPKALPATLLVHSRPQPPSCLVQTNLLLSA